MLPYFLFYRGKAGKLQEFSASLKRIQLLKWVQLAQQEGLRVQPEAAAREGAACWEGSLLGGAA